MFDIHLTKEAARQFTELESKAKSELKSRQKGKKRKSSKQLGLFKQVAKTIQFLSTNPKHRSLQTHQYVSLQNPYSDKEKVFEAYVQNNTPSAYRVFWCYGPDKGQITIISITPHP